MNKFVNILFFLFLVSVAALAQTAKQTMVADTIVSDSPFVQDSAETNVPEIEYSLQRKTYEIAGIEVSGADSYEDFVLIGFSGLAVGDKIEVLDARHKLVEVGVIRDIGQHFLAGDGICLNGMPTDAEAHFDGRAVCRPRPQGCVYPKGQFSA